MHKASIILFLSRSLFIFRRVLETCDNTLIKTSFIFFSRFLPVNYMMSQTTELLDITFQVQQNEESEASKNEGTYIMFNFTMN